MKKYTEGELLIQNDHSTFRLKKLYQKDRNLFNQLTDYLPNPIYINHRETFNHQYFSKSFFSYGEEIEQLYLKGASYLSQISELYLLNKAKKKATLFHAINDESAVCSYLQCVSLHKRMTHYFTTKCLIDDESSLNITFFPKNQKSLLNFFNYILPKSKNTLLFWQRFQSLTKQEKVILKLIAEGITSKEISERLFISKYTVITHRRNIFKKLDANSLADIIKFSMVLELV